MTEAKRAVVEKGGDMKLDFISDEKEASMLLICFFCKLETTWNESLLQRMSDLWGNRIYVVILSPRSTEDDDVLEHIILRDIELGCQ